MTPATYVLLAAAGLVAGGVNAVAGGGSLLSFPALLAAGLPSVTANVTNTVALFPGYAGSVAGGRRDLTGQRRRLRTLLAAGVVGSIGGCLLLLLTPSDVFTGVVPYLVLLACLLLLLQPRLSRLVQARHGAGRELPPVLLRGGVLVAGAYGAYFGAGLGVLLLAVLGVLLDEQLPRTNALKNVVSFVVNAVALIAFALFGPVAWSVVAVVAVASLLGGFAGARVARRLSPTLLRGAVVVYGVVAAVVLLARS